MKTAVVILNWNTRGFIQKWLPALVESCRGLDAEVIVADNASTDGTLEMMAVEFPGTRTIALDSNFGFTGGYNRALAQVEAEYYVLLNSDIVVENGWLEPMVEWMDSHPECGICGPKLHKCSPRDNEFEYAGAAGGYLDRFGYPFCRGRVLHRTEKDFGQYDGPAELMWVSGACLMTRASLWKRLGGLDDRFFAHMEEIDYCWRAQLAGFKVNLVWTSSVCHLGGGTLPEGSPFKLKLNFRNNLLMLQKNLPQTIGAAKARRRIFARKCLDGASALIYLLQGKSQNFKAVWQAHREAAVLSEPVKRSDVREVDGYREDICILLQSALKGNDIFKYLKDNENRN